MNREEEDRAFWNGVGLRFKHLCKIYILGCWNTRFIDEEC